MRVCVSVPSLRQTLENHNFEKKFTTIDRLLLNDF